MTELTPFLPRDWVSSPERRHELAELLQVQRPREVRVDLVEALLDARALVVGQLAHIVRACVRLGC